MVITYPATPLFIVKSITDWEFRLHDQSFQFITAMPNPLISYIIAEAGVVIANQRLDVEVQGHRRFIFQKFQHPFYFIMYDIK